MRGGEEVNKIYDCNLCMHKEVCDLWSKHECQDASSFQLDGCDYYQDKSRYICVDDVNGPGPDPKGQEGEPGQEGSIFQDLMDIFDGYMALKRAKEAKQCGDASGRGND